MEIENPMVIDALWEQRERPERTEKEWNEADLYYKKWNVPL